MKFLYSVLILLASLLVINKSNSLTCSREKVSPTTTLDAFSNPSSQKEVINETGFLIIDLAKMYFLEKNLTILNNQKGTLAFFENRNIKINGEDFHVVDEEHLYEEFFKVEKYEAEYNLFVIACEGLRDGFYIVNVNDEIAYIDKQKHTKFVHYKSDEQYFLDGYYYLDRSNHILRNSPHQDSLEITNENYTKYFFKAIEIRGDWLKLRDDKECPLGELGISDENIEGWIQWKDNGKTILEFSSKCW